MLANDITSFNKILIKDINNLKYCWYILYLRINDKDVY